MCNFALRNTKLFTTMIRQDCIHFNSYPATIALEKMEACKLFASKSLDVNRPSLFDHVDHLDEKFPNIDWEEENVDLVFEEARQRISLVATSQKRRKLSRGYDVSNSRAHDENNGLLRSKRILSELYLLDNQVDEYGLYHKTKPMRSNQATALDSLSSLSSGRDIAFEKRLQMSFYDDGGENQVRIIA